MSTASLECIEVFPGKAFKVRNVLSAEECAELIADVEKRGFESAALVAEDGTSTSVGGSASGADGKASETRNHGRVIVDDEDRAAALWAKVSQHVPSPDRVDKAMAVGLSSRFRFYRYEKGQKFARHYDGYSYGSVTYAAQQKGPQGRWTFLLYLNGAGAFEGGRTRFYGPGGKVTFEVEPEAGTALIYMHQMLHEGSEVTEGVKYVLRTDVMFAKEGEGFCSVQ